MEASKKKGWFSRYRRYVYLLLVIVIAYGIWYVFFRPKNSTEEYVTVAAARETIVSLVSETGEVTASGNTSVYSTTTGLIQELYVKNGDHVRVGQNLFKVRSTATDAEKASAYAAYTNAVAGVKTSEQNKIQLQAQIEAARKTVFDAQQAVDTMNVNLSNDGINPATKKEYTRNEIDSINSALNNAKLSLSLAEQKFSDADSAIAASKATLTSAQASYEATKDAIIPAPIEGTVANLAATKGENVTASSGSQTTTANPVLIIYDASNSVVKTQINEIDTPKIQLGQTATVTVDAIPGESYTAKVTKMDAIGTNTQGVISYNVYVMLDSPNAKIRPLMTANVDIEVNRKENALVVPNSAIKPYQNGKAVQLLTSANTPEFIPVKIGIISQSKTEILEGINDGTNIITGTKKQGQSSGGLFQVGGGG